MRTGCIFFHGRKRLLIACAASLFANGPKRWFWLLTILNYLNFVVFSKNSLATSYSTLFYSLLVKKRGRLGTCIYFYPRLFFDQSSYYTVSVFLFLVIMFCPNKFISPYVKYILLQHNIYTSPAWWQAFSSIRISKKRSQHSVAKIFPVLQQLLTLFIGTKLHLSHITSVLSFVDTS